MKTLLIAALATITSILFGGAIPEMSAVPVAHALPTASGATSYQPLNHNFSAGLSHWTPGPNGFYAADAPPSFTSNPSIGDNGRCVGAAAPTVGHAAQISSSNIHTSTLASSTFTIPPDAPYLRFAFGGAGFTGGAKISVNGTEIHSTTFAAGQAYSAICDVSAWAGQNVQISFLVNISATTYVLDGGTTASQGEFLNPDRTSDPISFVSGALTHSNTDLVIPGRGVQLEFTRTYYSGRNTSNGDLGYGWSHNYNVGLRIYDNGSVQVNYPSGAGPYFAKSGSVFVAPRGVFDALSLSGSVYTLITKAQVRYIFDSTGRLTDIKDRNSNTTHIDYDPTSGLISTVADPGGRQFVFTWDVPNRRITQILDPLNRTVGFAYDGNGDLVTVTDVKGGTTTYAYSNHRLVTLTDSLNHLQTTNVYDDADRVIKQTNAVGGITCMYYGIGTPNNATGCTTNPPTPSAGQTYMVDPRGNKELHQFDTAFRPTGIEDALGNDTTFTYETTGSLCSPANNGNLCSTTDPLGHTTSFTYDGRGNVLTRTDAAGKTTTYTYNAVNDPLAVTDPLTHTTTFVYNGTGNLASVTNANNKTTDYTPNADGTLASVTDPLSHATSFGYDAYGNRNSVTDANGHATTSTYDLGGRLLTVADPFTHTTTYTYDNQNNVLTAKDALNNVTTFVYDAKGQKTSSTDANNNTTTYGYDSAGNLTTVTDPLSQNLTYAYDANSNRVSMTNTRGKITAYAYDAVNRLITITDPLNRLTQYTYDAAGNVNTLQDGKRQGKTTAVTYTYDAVNRLTNIAYPDVHYFTAYTYDAVGNRLTMTDTRGVCDVGDGCAVGQTQTDTTTYAYDPLNRLGSVQTTFNGTKTVSYAYDDANNRTAMTYPDGKVVEYTFDAKNQMKTVAADWLTGTTTYTYDNADRLTNAALANGLNVDRTYDNANRLLTVVNRNGGTTLSSFTYMVDPVGNRSQVVDTTGTTTYGYDSLYRLTSTNYPNGDTQSYTYDPMGNRLTKVQNSVTTTYGYDDADQLAALNGAGTPFDKNGNLRFIGASNSTTDTFLYDQENRLFRTGPCRGDVDGDGQVSILDIAKMGSTSRYGSSEGSSSYDLKFDLDGDGAITILDVTIGASEFGRSCASTGANTGEGRYTYNGTGLRIRERTYPNAAPFVTRDFTWDQASSLPNILQETRTPNGGAAATVSYVYGLGLIAATDSAGGTSYVLSDGLGSTSQLADSGGAVTDSYTYDVFGAPRTVTGTTANDFRFTGQQDDVNANRGLYYLRARHYDPTLGRFLGRDPMGVGNAYAYGNSNPVNQSDPSGLDPRDDKTPVPNEDDGPVAAPLPIGRDRLLQRCIDGYEKCMDQHVGDAQKLFGGGEWRYSWACVKHLGLCRIQASAGNQKTAFDHDGAREDLGLPPVSHGIRLGIPRLPDFWPGTGSGGYLNSGQKGQKESAFVICLSLALGRAY